MSHTRRRWLQTALATSSGWLGLSALNPAGAQQGAKDTASDFESSAAELISREADIAIARGLKYLSDRQTDEGTFPGSGYSRNVAVAGLAGLAFLASGSTPRRGTYGRTVQRFLQYVLASADESGFLSRPDSTSHGPMYDHGFATLFLAEVYGMSDDSAVRERLSAAVKLIIATQNMEGGWRYQPRVHEADISVTICQVMALRAARNAGVFVPGETIERCLSYIKRSQNPDGGFMYMLDGTPSKFPRSAAGVAALFSAGLYEGEEIKKGLEYLMLNLPPAADILRDTHSLYGQYYAAQAMWQAGGDRWGKWYPAVRDALIAQQSAEGSWSDPISKEYGTAVACIILQMPNNYLPIFQR